MHQNPNTAYPFAFLAARRERPRRRRTADERDELSPSHELPSDEAII
jgi:hypothetical protein